jgi:hypothetical protein
MDNLEQFLKENRLRLDSEDIDADYWQAVEGSFRRLRVKKLIRQTIVAASIVLVLGTSAFFIANRYDQHKEVAQEAIFPQRFTELSKQETSYLQLISITTNQINDQRIPAEYQSLFSDFIRQLQIIDQQYELYKSEIKKHGYNEEMVQQVIYNYELKLSVLQMLHSEMNKINKLSKSNQNEDKKIQIHL